MRGVALTFDLGRSRTVPEVSTYTIGEAAERSGFSTSALRYYEGIGLVVPSTRSGSGYRLYDDDALDRLAFIASSKELGCTLEEISDLLELVEGERCEPVQRRLHDLVTSKIAAAQRHVSDVAALTARLQLAASRLGQEPVDGPCADGCACVSPPAVPGAGQALPVTCTLDATEVPGRRQAWRALLEPARSRSSTEDGGLRFELGDRVALEELARLVAAEQACCAFFSFTITVDGGGISLEVRAPEGAAAIVDELMGAPAP
jgi:MerR family copper efflux transcriptional regulator